MQVSGMDPQYCCGAAELSHGEPTASGDRFVWVQKRTSWFKKVLDGFLVSSAALDAASASGQR